MAKKGKGTRLGALQRSGPEVAQASMLISALMMTPDDGYDKFRARRAANRTLDPAHLGRARDILDAIAEAVGTSDGQQERWRRLELAWRALFETEPVVVATPPAALLDAAAAHEHAPPLPEPPRPVPLPPALATVTVTTTATATATVTAPPSPLPAAYESLPPHARAALAAMERAELGTASKLHSVTLPLDAPAPLSAPLPFVEGAFAPTPPTVARLTNLRETLEDVVLVPPGREQHAPRKPVTLPFSKPPSAPPPPSPTPAPAEGTELAQLPPHLTRLSVEQFATYCAQCAASPDDLKLVEQRYGISGPEQRAALERYWHGRLSKDPALLAAWREHLMRAKSFVGKR
jgi:hypothetical protein